MLPLVQSGSSGGVTSVTVEGSPPSVETGALTLESLDNSVAITVAAPGVINLQASSVPIPGSSGDILFNNGGVLGASAATVTAAGAIDIPETQLLTFGAVNKLGLTWISTAVMGVTANAVVGGFTGGMKMTTLNLVGAMTDGSASTGVSGQLLSSTSTAVKWVDSPTVPATTTRTAHEFFTTYDAGTGAFGQAQPVVADLADTPVSNTVLAGPAVSSPPTSATATFRSLVPADIPALPYLPSGTTLPATTSSVPHEWLNSYSAGTGAFGQAQPVVADLADTPAAAQVLAGPATGPAATGTFRTLVATDIPALSYVTSVGLAGTTGQISVTGSSPITGSGSWTLSLPAAVTVGTVSSAAGSIILAQTNAFTTTVQGAATASWTLTLPSTAGSNTNILQTDGAGNTSWVAKPVGTVTSVTFTGDGTILSSTPTPAVTSSGTLTATLNAQSANTVLAGPITGSPPTAAPTFRALVAADLPAVPWNSLANATGSLTLANGTYATTFNQTSAAGWTWAVTPASAITNSPSHVLSGVYEASVSPVSYAADSWVMQVVEGTGANGTSTLSFTQSGSLGTASVSVPLLNSINGYQVNGAAASGNYLRGNGTDFVSNTIQLGDLPSGYNAWSNLGNASANLTLSNAGYTSTFNQTSAAAWLWANTTTATGSTTNASPLLEVAANYWTGLASAADTWTIGSSLTAGTNKPSTLVFSHTGSTGVAAIQIPSNTSQPAIQGTTDSTCGIAFGISANINATYGQENRFYYNGASPTLYGYLGYASSCAIFGTYNQTYSAVLGDMSNNARTTTTALANIGAQRSPTFTGTTGAQVGLTVGHNSGGAYDNMAFGPVYGNATFTCAQVAPVINQAALTNTIVGTEVISNVCAVVFTAANTWTNAATTCTVAAVTNTQVNGTQNITTSTTVSRTSVTVTNSVETAGNAVTLTVGTHAIVANDYCYLSGLTVATWLNGKAVKITSVVANTSITFTDPTSHGAKTTGADTGTVVTSYIKYSQTASAVALTQDTGTATQQAIGTYTGLKIVATETVLGAASGNKLIDCYAGAAGTTPEFSVSNTGVTNTATGYQIGGAAPSNHHLVGNGTNYVDWTMLYADMHASSASITVTISGANTWVPIPTNASLFSSDSLGITFSGHTLTIPAGGAGVYSFNLSCSVSCGSANQLVSMTYAIGGTASTEVNAQTELVNSGRAYCLTLSDINTQAAGDAITIVLENNTAANNLTVESCSITLVRIA